jgi:catechol 2,3-dioxygenase-like lactoylglutathione lyase family enzyme
VLRRPCEREALRVDVGLTHVALPVADAAASIRFYERFAAMRVVHERSDEPGSRVVWLSDLTRPFVIVLIEHAGDPARLSGWSHLGVACASRDDVERLCADARADGFAVQGPFDAGPPVGYWAIIPDPDGHNLELSFGQDVGTTVETSRVR